MSATSSASSARPPAPRPSHGRGSLASCPSLAARREPHATAIGLRSAAGSVGGVNHGRRSCFFGGSERDPHHVLEACRASWVVTVAVRTATGRSGRLWERKHAACLAGGRPSRRADGGRVRGLHHGCHSPTRTVAQPAPDEFGGPPPLGGPRPAPPPPSPG